MKIKHFFAVILLSVSSAIATFYFLNEVQTSTNQIQSNSKTLKTPTSKVTYNTIGSTSFTDAAAKATPAVVHVKTSIEINTSKSRQFYGDDLFEWFFGHQNPNAQNDTRRQSVSSGSGVIISDDGYIVTNNHVIENANKIEIILSNNKVYQAELIGKDKDTDLAVLKIAENNLPSLHFANSDDVRIGEWVLAVGNPFNLSSTVTAGIVSAKGRNINILENYGASGNTAIESFIQTDAAVNPGNSGGALVNTKGELMGINTAIATPTGSFAGYSFAVPANLVNKVVEDIKRFGSAQRAYLGVNIKNIDTELAYELKLDDMHGIYIANLVKGGAAFEAGLQIGDVIKSIDNEIMNTSSELQEKIAEYRPGDIVGLEYIRNSKLHYIKLKLK